MSLVEVDPPQRSDAFKWSTGQVEAARARIAAKPGQWFSDGKVYPSRRQAYLRADRLRSAIGGEGLQRKTTAERGGFCWAIRQRPEGA